MRDVNKHCNNDEKYTQFESPAMKPDNVSEDQERELRATHQMRIAKRLQAVDEHVATSLIVQRRISTPLFVA